MCYLYNIRRSFTGYSRCDRAPAQLASSTTCRAPSHTSHIEDNPCASTSPWHAEGNGRILAPSIHDKSLRPTGSSACYSVCRRRRWWRCPTLRCHSRRLRSSASQSVSCCRATVVEWLRDSAADDGAQWIKLGTLHVHCPLYSEHARTFVYVAKFN